MVLVVLVSVFLPGITSTNGIRFTGLKKCMPMNRSGRFRDLAISVIERAEVFEAMIVSCLSLGSRSLNTDFLSLMFSGMASMMRSALAMPS